MGDDALFPLRQLPPHRGHASPPGHGPEGETRGSCAHAHRHQGNARAYWKCELERYRWGSTDRSDIALKAPACVKWEAADA